MKDNSMEAIADLNQKILKVTNAIRIYCPELSKYLEEMPETKLTKMKTAIGIKDLSVYYDSLRSLMRNYLLEHPISL